MKLLKTNYFVPLTTVFLALLLSIMLDIIFNLSGELYALGDCNHDADHVCFNVSVNVATVPTHTLSLLSLYLHHRAGEDHSDHKRAVSGILVGAEERETGLRDHCVCRELTPENHQESGRLAGVSHHTPSLYRWHKLIFSFKTSKSCC